MSIEEHKIFGRFYNLGLVETCDVDYTTFYLDLADRHWQRGHLDSRIDGSSLLIWAQFSEIFLEKYMPCNLRDCSRDHISRLEQRSMMVVVYETHFNKLARNFTFILYIKYEVCCFIRGLRVPLYMYTQSLVIEISSFAKVSNNTQVIKEIHHEAQGVAKRDLNIRPVLVGVIVSPSSEAVVHKVGTLFFSLISLSVILVDLFR